jgi:hypothetical protein
VDATVVHWLIATPSRLSRMARTPRSDLLWAQPGKEREVLVVPVRKLASVLRGLSAQGLTLEHIFDY